ncbi:MAG: hypothetical protein Q9M18_00590 [Mariprofundaceae bacterium]|nr:hypothetical protein [Mariprofundaceae bacterium]
MLHFRRFSDASVSEKLLDTMFLLTIGFGYLFALANIYMTHQGYDGEEGLSVKDVIISYHGKESQSRLATAINGPMEVNLPNLAAKKTILDWLEHGASKAEFEAKIHPIMKENCVMCHSAASGISGIPHFDDYEHVLPLTKTDTGASIPTLIKISHIHLLGIAFMLFLVGRIFILCEINVMLKRFIMIAPFIFLILDISSWYITKIFPSFAYLVIASGALVGITFAFQLAVSLYQMWFYHPKKSVE